MIIGVPKEIKNNESRVALTEAGVYELTKHGHEVLIEKGAGNGSGISNHEYVEAGATILEDVEELWKRAEMIIKVKEPIQEELSRARKGQIIFTYFHFASSQELTEAMVKSGAICIAYETVERDDRSLPLLIPMSEVAGRMAIQEGARYLEKPVKGRGVLLGGVPGVPPGKVLILGAGIVGVQAAKMASGLGAQVTVLDVNMDRLRYVNDILPDHVVTNYSSEYTIRKLIRDHDLIIGAVLIHGAKAPKLITRDMLKEMRPGTVIVDVAVDQGGCVETSKPTTHEEPTFIIEDVLHYGVANMPGAVPFTSTLALTNVTIPYILKVANKGWKQASRENRDLLKGLNIVEGKIVYEGVADAFGMEFTPAEHFLD
ncbi:MAG TPA: alanine dehydrogenase [Cryomorphaceae bacterium]|nr:alanine dehydrogenase [Owenweeksia sp.]MBF99888.1 alanine dehydrogenase [Owenweeksia sp.]HAD97562.1 alanine dehydrogenase [Cryomorphaceae bacterium]HCQ15500.1 alanine dehydrogenase [Cryomorphaceae bacterium]